MDKNAVQKLIDLKSERVSFEVYAGKSAVWKNFFLVNVDGDKAPFVKCGKCSTLLKWKSKDGTSSLNAHHQYCSPKSPLMKITDLPGFSGIPSQPKVPSSVKSQIANELVNMCARDIRPFSTVDGEGFQGLCKSLIAIGSKYGNVPIEQVLPCATTVSRHMESVLAKEKAALCEVLKTAVNFGITTDGWSHTSTNQQYITITIHFIDEQWKMHSHILATRDADEKHTADYIKQLVRSVMNEFAVYRPGIVFVTDNAANMKAAFRDELWIGCAGHNLNLVLSHGLQNSSIQSTAAVTELPTEVTGLIATCKELVTLVKRTKLNNSLDTTLKQCIQTRWNSVLRTLQSVYDNRAQLRSAASEPNSNRNLLRLLSDLSDELLEQVIEILKPFDTATRVLSTDKTPSLHLVVPTKYTLHRHLTACGTDNAVISQLKQHLLAQLDRYFNVSDIHTTATLLDPRMKNKQELMSAELRNASISTLRKMLENHIQTSTESSSQPDEPAAKRIKLCDEADANTGGFFGELFDRQQASDADELDSYMSNQGKLLLEIVSS